MASGLTTAMASRPLRWAQSVSSSTGSSTPKKLGWGITRAAKSLPAWASSASRSVRPVASSKGSSTSPMPWLRTMVWTVAR